ncbi:MAG: zinc ribbon domain-containing protein, partial [Candidatus Omnitrophica bacterium]|nr:zinc ribbon domain-containing protein [Candidatus Omnitrophota bacterium]
MPTYEYECEYCGYKFEKHQKMTDEAIKKCLECNKPVRRLIGKGAGIIFKGSGFHATDYGSDSSSSKTCCGRTERCDIPPCADDG